MKAIWRGNINFALVSIPVKLYAATHKRAVSFHMLHDKCSTPLHYERHCETCDVKVPWEHVARGYEYEKDHFVVVTDEEMDAVPLKRSRSIDIFEFVRAEEIEPIYFDKPYYIEPEQGAEKAYSLLRETLERTNKVPLAKFVLKDKEHLVAIMIHEGVLTLHTLYFADEITGPDSLSIPGKAKVERKEVELASKLVESYAGRLNIGKYRDDYRDALMELIKAKIEGRKVRVAPSKEARKVVSLMDALKKSLREKEKKKVTHPKKVATHRKRRKAG